MNAAELRAILAHVPDDLPVVIDSDRCNHIDHVERGTSGQLQLHSAAPCPAVLILRGYQSYWWVEPAPAFELRGRFRDAAGLEADLDALDPMPPEARP